MMGSKTSAPPPMTPALAGAYVRLVLAAIALPSEIAVPLADAAAKGARPDDAVLRSTIPYVERFYRAAMRDGLGNALGLTRQDFEQAALQHRSALWPELTEAEAVTLARQSAGYVNGEDPKEVISEIAAKAINAGQPIPPRIASAVVALLYGELAPAPRRGPDPDTYIERNTIISVCVRVLCMYGFSRTRNAASERPSACSVVAAIAGISEAAVVKIDTRNRTNRRARLLEE